MSLDKEIKIKYQDYDIAAISSDVKNEDTPTIFLHGWMDNANSFLPVASNFTDKPVYLIDLLGHGKSSHLNRPYSLDTYCHSLLHVIDELASIHKSEKVNLVGHSLGGVIASLVASSFPEKVSSLILVESIGPLVDNPDNASLRLRTSLARTDISSKSPRKYTSEDECIKARSASGEISKEDTTILAARGISHDESGYFWNHDRYLKVPSAIRYTEDAVRAILKAIKCPVTLIHGTSPLEIAKPYIKKRSAYIHNLSTHILPGGHHLHMTESVKGVTDIVRELL